MWWWRWQSHGTGSTSLWRKKLSTLTMTVLKMTHYVVKRYPALHTSIYSLLDQVSTLCNSKMSPQNNSPKAYLHLAF